MQDQYVLALDQGTTSSRTMLFDRNGNERQLRVGGAEGISADLSARGLGQARSAGNLVHAGRRRGRDRNARERGRIGNRGGGHYQSARDEHRMGS